MPDLEKYIIGRDPALLLPFAFDFLPITCKFHKPYTFTVTKRVGGAAVADSSAVA